MNEEENIIEGNQNPVKMEAQNRILVRICAKSLKTRGTAAGQLRKTLTNFSQVGTLANMDQDHNTRLHNSSNRIMLCSSSNIRMQLCSNNIHKN